MNEEFDKDKVYQLAKLIQASPDVIFGIAENPGKHYKRFPINTGRARPRWIDAPSGPLKAIQRSLLDHVLYEIAPHSTAHGFYPTRSIITNARNHVGKDWVLSFDIKDFFPSTSQDLVVQTLSARSTTHATSLWSLAAWLCCLNGSLPQGAPTSPHLANLCFYVCDEMLCGLANAMGLVYTRYADDMTFSGSRNPPDLEKEVDKVISPLGYVLAPKKTKIMDRSSRQCVTGLVVNEKIALTRELKKKLRAIRHDAGKRGVDAAVAQSGLVNSGSELWGYLAFQEMVEHFV